MIAKIFNIINLISKHVGYIYVFRYVNGSEKLVKIGVSNKPKRRFSQVKAALPGKLIYWGAFPALSPYITESYLHKRFAHKKQTPNDAGSGAGKDEFFKLSYIEGWKVILFLWFVKSMPLKILLVQPIFILILYEIMMRLSSS